jgi:phasin family protein
MIKNTPEQFAAANKAAVDSVLNLANMSLAATERLAALNLNTARAFMADSAANVGAIFAAKDPQGFVALQSTLAKPAIEKAMTYSKSVYEIMDESVKGISQIAEGQAAEAKKNFTAAVEQTLKNAPAGSETIVAAVKSAMAQADSAYEQMNQSAKQAKATMEAGVASANAAAAKMLKAA